MHELWYALKVRPNAEWVVATNLRNRGYEQFLPTYRKQRYWSDRTKMTEFPLFRGYLFCRFDAKIRLPILKIPGVHSVVGVGRNPEPINSEEIEAIRAVVQSGVVYEPHPYIAIGQLVRVREGSLYGLTGRVITVKNKYRLIISVNLLMRSVSVEIDRNWVEPIDGQLRDSMQIPACSPGEAKSGTGLAGGYCVRIDGNRSAKRI